MLEHHLKKKRVKEKNIYSLIYNLIKKRLNQDSKVLDIGCGNGDFLNFINSKKNCHLYGVEANKKLFNFAKKNNKNFKFYNKDFIKFRSKSKFDIVTAISVASHFNNIEIFLNGIKRISKKNSSIIISGIFNSNNIDVYIKYRYKNKIYGGHTQHNIKRVYKWAIKNDFKVKIQKENLPFSIPKKNILLDPARSYTAFLNKKKMTINGLQVIYNIQIIHLYK